MKVYGGVGMNILKGVKKVPGGIMIIPLLLGAMTNTFFPELWKMYNGTFTFYLWKSGAMPILAAFLFCTGATIDFKQAGMALFKGVTLNTIKVGLGMVIGIIIARMYGEVGILGLSPLAIIAAIANSNGGLYSALAAEYGDATDVGAVSILSINDGPFFTLLALGAAGYAVPINTLIGCVIPIVVGMVLANLDPQIRKFCEPGVSLLIPFFAFPLGAGLTLTSILKAGPAGIILGVASTVITGIAGYLFYKVIKMKKAEVGAAIGTTAGNAASTPAAVAAAGVISTQVSNAATAQISAAIIVTAILCPLLVTLLHKHEVKLHPEDYGAAKETGA